MIYAVLGCIGLFIAGVAVGMVLMASLAVASADDDANGRG